jgi:hypothetical protein
LCGNDELPWLKEAREQIGEWKFLPAMDEEDCKDFLLAYCGELDI